MSSLNHNERRGAIVHATFSILNLCHAIPILVFCVVYF